METILDGNQTEERTTTLKLTERDVFLIEWSLDMMARSPLKSGTLRLDIDKLRCKLAMKQSYQQ
jgi:hypothetical protein